MPLDLQYDIVDDTPAAAGPVEANFNRIEQYINQEVIARDGHVAMIAQLRLVGLPVSELDAASKSYVDAVLPVGVVMPYGGASTPPGGKWLVCDGASYATADYAELFAVIGNTFGGTAGNFNVPNMGGKMVMGTDASHVVGSTGGTADSVGVGAHTHAIDHTHAVATSGTESVDHTHTAPNHSHKMAHTHLIGDHRHTFLPSQGNTLVLGQTNVGTGLSIDSVAGPNQWNHVNTTGDLASSYNTGSPSPTDTDISGGGSSSGGRSAAHTHTVAVPALAQASGPASVAGTNGNLPPYVGLTMIIRAK
jgi:microcystin-dependent protein